MPRSHGTTAPAVHPAHTHVRASDGCGQRGLWGKTLRWMGGSIRASGCSQCPSGHDVSPLLALTSTKTLLVTLTTRTGAISATGTPSSTVNADTLLVESSDSSCAVRVAPSGSFDGLAMEKETMTDPGVSSSCTLSTGTPKMVARRNRSAASSTVDMSPSTVNSDTACLSETSCLVDATS